MIEESKIRALSRSLVVLLITLVAGLAVAHLVVPDALAWATMRAAGGVGLLLAVVLYLAAIRERPPRAESPAQQEPGPREEIPLRSGQAGTYLLIRLEEENEIPAPGFLASAVGAQRGEWSWEGQQVPVAKDAMRWTATADQRRRIDVIEFAVSSSDVSAAQRVVVRALLELRLAGPQVRAWEFVRSLLSGRMPFHLDRFSGVILSVPHGFYRDDPAATAIESLFRTIGQATQSRYPAYIVLTGLDEIPGCAEALARIARERPATLAEPIGYFFPEHIAVEDLRRATHTAADVFGRWLPFLLERENDSAESTLRLAESMRRAKLRGELSEKRQRLFELVPRLESIGDEIAARLHTLRVQWGTSRWGPELRAVLYSGAVTAGALAQEDMGYTYTRLEGGQRQRAFVARFLTQDLPALRTASARVLGPVARTWWTRAYLAAAALAFVLMLLVGVSTVLNWRS